MIQVRISWYLLCHRWRIKPWKVYLRVNVQVSGLIPGLYYWGLNHPPSSNTEQDSGIKPRVETFPSFTLWVHQRRNNRKLNDRKKVKICWNEGERKPTWISFMFSLWLYFSKKIFSHTHTQYKIHKNIFLFQVHQDWDNIYNKKDLTLIEQHRESSFVFISSTKKFKFFPKTK